MATYNVAKAVHEHAVADVTGLQAELDAKQDKGGAIEQTQPAGDSTPHWTTHYTEQDFSTTVRNTAEHYVSMKGGVNVASNLASWLNEWGALRGTSPYAWGDSLVRGIKTADDGTAGGNFVELDDRSSGTSHKLYGRSWDDGSLVRNDKAVTETYTWKTGDADPTDGGTNPLPAGATWILILDTADTRPTWAPANSIIVRKNA